MHRIAFLLHLVAKRAFWGVVGPLRNLKRRFVPARNLRGVKCVVQSGEHVLLVRIAYAHRFWTLPGGGVKRRESWLAAALRETAEETGINVIHARYIGEYAHQTRYTEGTVRVYHSTLRHRVQPQPDGIEIAEASWFPRSALPENRAPRLDKILELLNGTAAV